MSDGNYHSEPLRTGSRLMTYTRTGADINGRVAIDWGVYGVPETFVADKTGRIAYKVIGQLTPQLLQDTVLPLIRELRK